MRNILILAACALLLTFLSVACSSQFNKERSLVSTYLANLDKIDNSLNQTLENVLASTDSSDPVAISDAVNKYISAAQSATQQLGELSVPAISAVQAQFDAYKSALQARMDALEQIKGTMVHGDESAYSQAYDQFVAAGKQVSAAYRLTEALLTEYKLSDSEVAYKSRGR